MARHPAAGPVRGLRQRLIVRAGRLLAGGATWAAIVSMPAPLVALELRVTELRVGGVRVSTTLEVRDLLRGGFLALVQQGRAVFLQLEADLWEDRRVFDRIVATLPPATWRVDRDDTGTGVLIQDQHGESRRHEDVQRPLVLRVDLGPATRIDDSSVYYLHATITAATVDERDIDRAGQAIFGDEQSARGLAGLGRFVFKTLLRMGKYFESATTDVTSRRLSGREIRTGAL
ncbi:MAG: hypothetical protein ACRD26_09505 [Vicinamibacterales bacterium]